MKAKVYTTSGNTYSYKSLIDIVKSGNWITLYITKDRRDIYPKEAIHRVEIN